MTTDENLSDVGGESACFVHLVCPECGVVLGDADHQPGCSNVELESTLEPIDAVGPSPGENGQ